MAPLALSPLQPPTRRGFAGKRTLLAISDVAAREVLEVIP